MTTLSSIIIAALLLSSVIASALCGAARKEAARARDDARRRSPLASAQPRAFTLRRMPAKFVIYAELENCGGMAYSQKVAQYAFDPTDPEDIEYKRIFAEERLEMLRERP